MKLKTYTAQTMAAALEIARNEIGEDALIVSSERDGYSGGVRITVAIEDEDVSEKEIEQALFGEVTDKKSEEIKEILDYHGIPEVLCERIINLAGKSQTLDIQEGLSYGFNEVLRLSERRVINDKIIMVVGSSGSGKSSMVAKLAAEAKLAGKTPGIITTDTYRAGANVQLQAFAKILEADIIGAKKPDDIIDAAHKLGEMCDVMFIDTQAVNPYNDKDLIRMNEYSSVLPNIVPLLVFEAGRNTEEAIEQFCIFAENGVNNASVTKVDVAKRMGGIIAGAYHSSINLRDVSLTQSIAGSLKEITPDVLTQLLLPVGFLNKE